MVCAGDYWVPTIAAGDGGLAVGCVPYGSQSATPVVKLLDGAGNERTSRSLLTSDGYYYTDVQLTHLDGRFQVLYEYNCDDDGSWAVGWGWGCIDFREYDATGLALTGSTVFGLRGLNGHPVLDWSGSELGVAWVSYDDIYFRRIGADRELIGGNGDPLANTFLGHDPDNSDDRDGARTKIAWDGAGWGVFSIIGYDLYFVRVGPNGAVTVPLTRLTAAYSQTFGGQFQVLARGGAYFVLYSDTNPTTTRLMKVSLGGTVVETVTIQSGVEIRFPSMFERGGLFYVLTHDANGRLLVTLVDQNLDLLPARSGVVGAGQQMKFAVPAYDPETDAIAVAYINPSSTGHGHGDVMLQLLSFP